MNEVIAIRYPQEEVLGGYNPLNGNVYYSEHLDRSEFASLKKFVLGHEMQHFRKPFNIFWHIYIDARDYPAHLCGREWYEYNKSIKKAYYCKMPWYWPLAMIFYSLVIMIFGLLLLVPQIISGLIFSYQDWRKKKNE
jgi:hypothetical protein